MAASASDKARKSYSYLQKTLSSGISDVATVLTPNNVTNIPTDTGVSFVVDRVDSNGVLTPTLRELMTGYVSGSTITGLVRGEQGTTAQSHLSNAVIEFVNSGEMWNDLIDFVMQDHSNPNGYHKNLTDANGNEWIKQTATASAINELTVANAAVGNAPELSATGDDTNINLRLKGKGTTGRVYTDLHPPLLYAQDGFYSFVASGGIWSGDAYASTLAASMTALVCYINGRRIAIAAVAARAFTASKDTYVDVLDNADGTGTLVYTEVTNNAASPSLAANSIRIATVVTAASNIAASTSIGQGGFANIAPVISSQVFKGFDSLGNLIYPKGPSTPALTQTACKFSASGSATTLAASVTLMIGYTEVFDTGSNFNPTTGLFTAPIAGYYQFTGCVIIGTSNGTTNVGRLLARKNGAEIRTTLGWVTPAVTGVAGGSYSFLLQLKAGDTVGIVGLVSSGGATPSEGVFEGYLVSAS